MTVINNIIIITIIIITTIIINTHLILILIINIIIIIIISTIVIIVNRILLHIVPTFFWMVRRASRACAGRSRVCGPTPGFRQCPPAPPSWRPPVPASRSPVPCRPSLTPAENTPGNSWCSIKNKKISLISFFSSLSLSFTFTGIYFTLKNIPSNQQ